MLPAEGNEGYVIDMWQQVLSGAMDWCRVLSSGLRYPLPICKTVLIHRATLITVQAFYVKSCLISKDLKQNAKKKQNGAKLHPWALSETGHASIYSAMLLKPVFLVEMLPYLVFPNV